MEEERKVDAAAFGFPGPVRPGVTRVGWIGIGVMGGAMAKHLLAAGFAVTVYARTPAKSESLVAARASLVDSPAAVAAASDVVFTMVGNPGDVRAVVLNPTTGALAGLRPGGVLVDCTSSSPSLLREIAAAASVAGCYAVDAPVSGGDVGARDGTLAIFAGGDEAVVAWLAPLFAYLGKATHMGAPGSGQSSKIANQIAVAGAARPALRLPRQGDPHGRARQRPEQQDRQPDRGGRRGGGPRRVRGLRQRCGARRAAVPRRGVQGRGGLAHHGIFGDRVLRREFGYGGSVRYIVKDLGMALEVGDGPEEANVLPGAALYRQMFSAMAANGDGDLSLQGLITVVERLNGIGK
ncbi:hypothetical protein C2845_PM05G29550 [Panicum miliaceum]|uniref:6-phosphogluconate dehydrogenase NADP-binding domain-containing protein n=1 Tax=Panicum miliaceum TaxID=4540 RepID=A0A3L6SYV4_PANMI|nr:hypothetical protein C2845_PM05G29550 [Panicum miliaceum]